MVAELFLDAVDDLACLINWGIKTQQQATIFRSMNCTVGQGFLFGRPAPVNGANSLIAEQNVAHAKGNLVRVSCH